MKILLSYYPRFIPIARALQKQGHEIIAMHPGMAKMLNDADIPTTALNDLMAPIDRMAALNYSAEVLSKVYPINMNGLESGPTRFVQNDIRAFMYQRLSDVSALVAVTHRVHPDLIMVHNDVEPGTRAIAMWAKSNSVPCLHVPHAVYMDVGRGAAGTDVHDIVTATHLAAAGPYQRAWYEERGMKPENVRETGLPQFDHFPVHERTRARRLLKIDLARPVIAYATSWRQDTNLLGCHDGIEEWYRHFIEAIKLLPGVQVIIKTHPSATQENLQFHANIAKENGVHCIITPIHLEIVLSAADMLIAYGPSNILLEGTFVPELRLVATP